MKFLPLVWMGLWQKPVRTVFTVVCVMVAFLLFGLLQGVDSAFSAALQQWRLDRLFVDARFGQPLPLAYKSPIASIPGITYLTEVAFLRGYYQDPRNGVLVIATTPEVWLAVRPEVSVPPRQIQAIQKARTGALVSDYLAAQEGWKIGDKITLHTNVVAAKGSSDWSFDVVGVITDAEKAGDNRIILANFKYYDENHQGGPGTTDRYLVRIGDPRSTARITHQIDQLFVNAPIQTRTQSEQETSASTIASIGDISYFTRAIMAAVFFTLLLLIGNTMMESVRERTRDFAVLRTVGFSQTCVMLLIVTEAVLLCTGAACLGLTLAAAAFPIAATYIGTPPLPPIVLVWGLVVATGVAFVSAIIPAGVALRLNLIDALNVQ